MRRQIEGSKAVAETVALCRPAVVAAYPISPQTHIVERLSELVAAGDLADCAYLMVESEFGALSACIVASAAGGRTYTAPATQRRPGASRVAAVSASSSAVPIT